MPINPQVPLKFNVYKARDIIVDALIEIGVLSPGEEDNLDPSVGQWAFRKANYLLDEWAAERKYVPAATFQTFNLVAGLSPHTIGPGTAQVPATFPVNQRPVRIESWSLILNNSSNIAVDLPRRPTRDKDWWAVNRVKNLQSNIPTDLYYEPDTPNGSCFFWPVPNTVFPVRLELWNLLSQFSAITDPVDGPGGGGVLPPAYRNAFMLTLAESLLTGNGKEADASLERRAAKARAAVFGNNSKSPRMATDDWGMSPGRRRADFNWETGNLA